MGASTEINPASREAKISRVASKSEGETVETSNDLKRGFKNRHVNMFAIAGSIGTGLIIGSGQALAAGGPGSILLSYCIMGLCVYFVMSCFAEMAIFAPMNKGFSGYCTRFVDPALGFAAGWNYFFKYSVLLANNLTATGLIISYWREDINVGIWIASFGALVIALNFLPVEKFGEVEFVMAIFKIIVLVGLILCCFIISLGGSPTGRRIGFRYWNDPGAFAPYLVEGATGRFLGFWTCVVQAAFMFMGAEVVGITYGEAANPRKAIPRAVKQTIARIAFFYIGGVIVLGMSVPYTNELLLGATKAKTSASASPFVVAMKLAGIEVLPGIVNASFLLFTISFATSDIYIASRTLYGLARDEQAPSIFAKTNDAGVPIYAVIASSTFVALAFLNVSTSSAAVFSYFVSLSTILGLINWVNIIVSYYCFQQGIKAQGIGRAGLPWKAPLQPYAIYVTLLWIIIVIIFSGFSAFIHGFNLAKFLTSYIGIVVYLFNVFIFKAVKRSKRVKASEMDLVADRRLYLDEEPEEQEKTGFARRIASALWGRYLRRLQRAAGSRDVDDDDVSTVTARGATSSASCSDNVARQHRADQESEIRSSYLEQSSVDVQPSEADLSNPLASTVSAYVADDQGRLRSLGESSTWSFSRRTLMLIKNQVDHPESPMIPVNEESRAYGLSWGSSGFESPASFSDLPSIDHAIYLLNGVKFHISQLYHLFDENEFTHHFHQFYGSPAEKAKSHRIWYVQFLTLLALGKAVAANPVPGVTTLPGSELFIRAMSLLPDPSYMFSDALTAVEALCAIALYLQCADMRNSAYVYIGQALRTAVTYGLHRDRPTQDWSPALSDRCQRAWWTVYILDRTFSSSMGVPIAIQDTDITTPMPPREGSHKSTALFTHVKLSRLISGIVNKVYGAEGRLRSSFLPSVHEVLGSIATIAGDLNECFPLSCDGSGAGISRVAAHLHLFYHQTILLTMYPLLLYLFDAKVNDGSKLERSFRTLSETSQALLQTCEKSCNSMIGILSMLQRQSLLESSPPFDLERTFASAFVSVMMEFILPPATKRRSLLGEAHRILDELVSRGCVPARFRRTELDQLDEMTRLWNYTRRDDGKPPASSLASGHQNAHPQELDTSTPDELSFGHIDGDLGEMFGLLPDQMLSLAESVQQAGLMRDSDWVDSWLWDDVDG